MLILALDSTALSASVALCEDEALIAEFTINTGHTHSETLLPMVEAALKIAGRTVDEVDLFACTAGPGSFTGVRIGAATIKGIAIDKNKPCIGVSTLESLAYNGAIPADGKVIHVVVAKAHSINGIIKQLIIYKYCCAYQYNHEYYRKALSSLGREKLF